MTMDKKDAHGLFEILLSPNGSEKLPEEALDSLLSASSSWRTLPDRELSAFLSYLVRLCRRKSGRQKVTSQGAAAFFAPSFCESLVEWLRHPSPKVRKNAARLAGQFSSGALSKEERLLVVRTLAEALSREEVRLVRPSQILALGAFAHSHEEGQEEASRAAADFLAGWKVEEAHSESEIKHQKREEEELRKARSAMAPSAVKHKVLARVVPEVFFPCEKGAEQGLAEDLLCRGVVKKRPEKACPGLVRAEAVDLSRLPSCRLWTEWLVPLRQEGERLGGEVLCLAREMCADSTAEDVFCFRAEVPGNRVFSSKEDHKKESRLETIRQLVQNLESGSGGHLVNNPSSYELEIRKLAEGKNTANLPRYGLKFCAFEDARFSYRVRTVPASIHPVNAARIMQAAAPYLKKGAHVLDPCCGSGTLLLERLYFQPGTESVMSGEASSVSDVRPGSALGTDIDKTALSCAAENVKQALSSPEGKARLNKVRIHLKRADLSELTLADKVDEVFANLPFGNRVGTHVSNQRLYPSLVKQLPRWLAPGGIAFLYTMEWKMLKTLLEEEGALAILQEVPLRAGGLVPHLFIVKRK